MASEIQPDVIVMQDVEVVSIRDASRTMVAHVTWRAAAGEFWVVGGGQQAGKTDFLMMTAGLMPPAAGSYQLFGRETRDFGEAELAERLRVGFVFDHGQLFNRLTLAENIALSLRYHRNVDEIAAEQETQWLLDWLELTPYANQLPMAVSRDWLKRAALARALVLRPHLLLCDHPLSGVGSRHRQWWVQFLDQLCRGHERLGGQPMTVVITAEDLTPWKTGSRRFALLRDQQFFTLGSWSDVEKSTDPSVNELIFTQHEVET
jgi:ABC-type transporter Mla maintaining outer membrane lipid asymmetry ATPase subunit MlaF